MNNEYKTNYKKASERRRKIPLLSLHASECSTYNYSPLMKDTFRSRKDEFRGL